MMYRSISHLNQWDTSHASVQLIAKRVSFCLVTASSPLLANPAGGDVVGGSATIDYGTTTVITQHTDKAIVNWQDFSINEHETTQFVQPSSSSIILNRVVGGNASYIMGKLQSNGTVFLVNPNGIVFGKDAVVDVGGLVASTASIANQQFMDGHYQFTDAPDGSGIINHGRITIAQSGYAALVAPNVVNAGVIEARLGEVVLASGRAFTVDLYGDNLITLDATALVSSSTVKNSGVIIADGGQVSLNAGATDALVESLINMDGYIQAQSVGQVTGKVVLKGNAHTTVTVAGNIDVSGKDADETGGVIQATGRYLKLTSGSVLDASGDAGGGTVHIGSDTFHNPNDPLGINTFGEASTLDTAQFVYGAADTLINANAINRGDGGNIVVWADQNTWYYGNITATTYDGDGGRVETSGHYLDVAGIQVNTSSILGRTGLWLLDPADILVVGTGATAGGTFNGGNPNTFTPSVDTVTATLNAADISAALASNNVMISTGGGSVDYNITFDSTFNNTNPISWATTNTLTVLATGSIVFNADNNTDNVMNLSGGGLVNLRADSDSDGLGTVTLTNGRINAIGASAQVNIYYNPVDFSTPVDYTALTTGTATQKAYMLVHDAVAGKHLSDINLDAITRDQNYALSQNLSTGLSGFTPIEGFTGEFTGANYSNTNYSITGLTTSGTGERGLFASVTFATVSDLTLNDFVVTSTNSRAGALTGFSFASFITGNILVNGGSITGVEYVGGVIGYSDSTNITAGLSSSADVIGTTRVGGLIGFLFEDNISGSSAFNTTTGASVSGVDYVGGLIGQLNDRSSFTRTGSSNIYSTGTVTGTGSYTGGLFGSVSGGAAGIFNGTGTLTNNATITGVNATGGIFGSYERSGVNAYTLINADSGNISSLNSTAVGGIAGFITAGDFTGGFINTGNVIAPGSENVGGLIGNLSGGTISGSSVFQTNAKSSGNTIISGDLVVGGLIGNTFAIGSFTRSAASVNHSGSFGVQVSGTNTIGGLFGWVVGTGAFTPQSLINSSPLNTVTGSTDGYSHGGVIASFFMNTSYTLDVDITNAATVSGGFSVAGVIGSVAGNSTITFTGDMVNTGNITADSSNVGGVFGTVFKLATPDTFLGTYTNSGDITVTSSFSGEENVGGVFGYFEGFLGNSGVSDVILSNSGNVSAPDHDYVGGVIGKIVDSTVNSDVIIMNSGGNVTGLNYVGGAFGEVSVNASSAPVINSASVTGNQFVGGIAGHVDTSGSLNQVVMTSGTVSGNTQVGGIAGRNDGILSDVLFGATLLASGASPTQFGGIAGANTGTITNALALGNMNTTNASTVGALVGNNSGTVNTSYYDSRLFSTSIGTGNAGGTSYNTNAAFYTPSSYIGFTFPSPWFLSGTSFYASLAFCGSSCKISLPATPPSPSTPALSSQTIAGISQVISSNQASGTASTSSVAAVNSPQGIFSYLNSQTISPETAGEIRESLTRAGLSYKMINQIIFMDIHSFSLKDFATVVAILSDYYEHTACSSANCGASAHISRHEILDTGYATIEQRYHAEKPTDKSYTSQLSTYLQALLKLYHAQA